MDAAFLWNLSKLGKIGSRRVFFDDDVVDRLNYQYTSVLLFLFIGLIGIRQYVGKPIQCWIPQEFTRGWEEYAENYCWVSNTYFAPVNNHLPAVPDRRELQLVYYQWAPIVMVAQALLFYLPCLTWRLGMRQSGFNVQRILQMSADTNEVVPETISKTVTILAHYIRRCILRQIKHMSALEATQQGEKTMKHQQEQIALVRKTSGTLSLPTSANNLATEQVSGNKGRGGKHDPGRVSFTTTTPIQDENANDGYSDNQPIRCKKQAPPPPPGRQKMAGETLEQRRTSNRESISPKLEVYASQTVKPHGWRGRPGFGVGRKWGNYLSSLYLTVKLCYLLNLIGQLYLMRSFVGSKYVMYGASVLQDLIRGKDWHQSGHFPRVTFCDLEAKKLGKNHIYTLQCVLPLNMFLEKIYIFLWFWFVTLGVITAVNLMGWLYRIHSIHSKASYVQNCLKGSDEENHLSVADGLNQEKRIRHFVQFYLGQDGVFLLRLISANSGGILTGEVLGNLWQSYQHSKAKNEQKASSMSNASPDQSHRPTLTMCCTCEPVTDTSQVESHYRAGDQPTRCMPHRQYTGQQITCSSEGHSTASFMAQATMVHLNGTYVSANGMPAFESKITPSLRSNESFGDIV